MHRHSLTCYPKKGTTKKCRFNIPFPVLPETNILNPLTTAEEPLRASAKQNYEEIKKYMNDLFKNPREVAFEVILEDLKLTKEQYILAIRSTLKTSKPFLKRKSTEVSVNYYNSDILRLFESNMDIQFVLDEYAVATYIVNYISKTEATISKMLREAITEMNAGNIDLQTKLLKVANIFNNAKLLSAQEAAYICLSLKHHETQYL